MSRIYNRMKAADRKENQKDLRAELKAIEDGTWPRDLNDQLRYGRPDATYVKKLVEIELAYLEDLENRIIQGDEGLTGYER